MYGIVRRLAECNLIEIHSFVKVVSRNLSSDQQLDLVRSGGTQGVLTSYQTVTEFSDTKTQYMRTGAHS